MSHIGIHSNHLNKEIVGLLTHDGYEQVGEKGNYLLFDQVKDWRSDYELAKTRAKNASLFAKIARQESAAVRKKLKPLLRKEKALAKKHAKKAEIIHSAPIKANRTAKLQEEMQNIIKELSPISNEVYDLEKLQQKLEDLGASYSGEEPRSFLSMDEVRKARRARLSEPSRQEVAEMAKAERMKKRREHMAQLAADERRLAKEAEQARLEAEKEQKLVDKFYYIDAREARRRKMTSRLQDQRISPFNVKANPNREFKLSVVPYVLPTVKRTKANIARLAKEKKLRKKYGEEQMEIDAQVHTRNNPKYAFPEEDEEDYARLNDEQYKLNQRMRKLVGQGFLGDLFEKAKSTAKQYLVDTAREAANKYLIPKEVYAREEPRDLLNFDDIPIANMSPAYTVRENQFAPPAYQAQYQEPVRENQFAPPAYQDPFAHIQAQYQDAPEEEDEEPVRVIRKKKVVRKVVRKPVIKKTKKVKRR